MQPNRIPLPVLLLLVLAAVLSPRAVAAQSLRGSATSVARMYHHAVNHGIYFYKTSSGIQQAAREGRFVRLSGNASYTTAGVSHPYVRPETRTFVERLGAQYRSACGERLVVTSAARPRSMRLANSVTRSVHPTGMAIDLRKPTRSSCLKWLRGALIKLEGAGLIEATEERSPPHFHVAVFPTPYQRYVQGKGRTLLTTAAAGGSGSYRVRSGDSLWGIARRHETTVAQLKAANGLRSSNLKVGQTLRIPSGR